MRLELERMLAGCILLAATSAAGAAATANETPLLALVDGTVTLHGGTAVAPGDRLAVPLDLDSRAGSASLVWEGNGARLLVEGVRARVKRADGRGVRLSIGDVRVDVPPGQGLHVKHRPEKTPRLFLRAPEENTSSLTLSCCQTLVRVLPGGTVSVLLDRDGMKVSIHGEGGVVEVLDREASLVRVHAGERLLDGCTLPPGEVSLEPPETRSAITPFEP